MNSVGKLAEGLAWLLEEASRGHLDPKGKDLGRIEQWLTDVLSLATADAMDELRYKLSPIVVEDET